MLVGMQGGLSHSCPGTCLSALSPSTPLLNPANPTQRPSLSEAMPAFSSFWKVLTKRPRLRGFSLQVSWNWQFWCGKDSQGYSGQASTPILRHTSSWTKGNGITWGRGWDDFLWDLLLGLELFLRRSRTHFCGGGVWWVGGKVSAHFPYRRPPPGLLVLPILPQTLTLVVIVVVCVVCK